MRNTCLLPLILLLSFSKCAAQTDNADTVKTRRFSFCIATGLAYPNDPFATYRQRENNNSLTGYTLAGPPARGITYQLSATYAFHKNFGAELFYCSTINSTPALSQQDVYPDPPPGSGGLGGGGGVLGMSYWAGPWRSANFLAGLFATTQGPISLKVKLLAGIQAITCPEVRINGNGYYRSGSVITFSTFSIVQEKSSANVFAMDAGVEGRAALYKGLFLKLDMDVLFSHGDLKLNFVEDYNDGTSSSYMGKRYSNTVTKSISYLLLSAGIGYAW